MAKKSIFKIPVNFRCFTDWKTHRTNDVCFAFYKDCDLQKYTSVLAVNYNNFWTTKASQLQEPFSLYQHTSGNSLNLSRGALAIKSSLTSRSLYRKPRNKSQQKRH